MGLEQEGYQPSGEEIRQAEEMMDDKQKDSSEYRERLDQRRERLSETGKKAYEISASDPATKEIRFPAGRDTNLDEDVLISQIEALQSYSKEMLEATANDTQRDIQRREEWLTKDSKNESIIKGISAQKKWLEVINLFIREKE